MKPEKYTSFNSVFDDKDYDYKYSSLKQGLRTIFRRKVFILSMALSLLILLFNKFVYLYPPDIIELPEIKKISGVILYYEVEDYGLKLTCKTDMGKIIVYWYAGKDVEIEPGGDSNETNETNGSYYNDERDDDRIKPGELIGEHVNLYPKKGLELPDPRRNPRCFDYRLYLLGKGINYTIRCDRRGVEIVDGEKNKLLCFKGILIKSREEFLNEYYPDEDDRAFARGILFGDSGEIDEEVYESFQGNNTAHILAVSGLHIGILYGVFISLRKRAYAISEHIGKALTIIFIGFLAIYGTLTLWTPSITRAVFLVYLKMFADRNALRYDMLNAVSIVNIIMLVISPYEIYSVGFQMSFLCAYAISIVIPRLRGKLPDIVLLPLGIQVFLLPYMLRITNTFSPMGFISNIAVVFLASIYVPIGIIGFILNVSSTGVILTSLGRMTVWINDLVYSEGRFSFNIPSPSLLFVGVYMMVVILISSEAFLVLTDRENHSIKKQREGSICLILKSVNIRLVVVVILIIAAIGLLFGYIDKTPFDDASEIFIDVGQGDAIHLNWDNDSYLNIVNENFNTVNDNYNMDILIDGGGKYNYNVGKKVLKPYLLKNGNSDLELALFTHDHMDHYKGLEELMEEFDVKEMIVDGMSGDIIEISDERYIEILWPLEKYSQDKDKMEDENYYSRVYMVYDNGIKTLITGDITSEGEHALIREYGGTNKLKCHILKIPHHGSKYSSSIEFLKETNPLIAVISVGKNNNYGHPAPEVIEKLADLGIIIYRTDLDGAVGIIPGNQKEYENNSFSVCTEITKKYDTYLA